MLLLLVVGLARADCPDAALAQALEQAGQVELTFSTADEAGFDAAVRELDRLVPCVTESLTAADAVALHRARGLAAFVTGDIAGSGRSWAAIRTVQPSWQPSPSLMPEGHPVRDLWDAARAADAELPIDREPPGGWAVDGMTATGIPSDRAFVLQGFGRGGEVLHTGYHLSQVTIPTLDIPASPAPVSGSRRRTVRTWGTVGAGALAVGAGVAGAQWARSLSQLNSTGYATEQEIWDLRQKANTRSALTVTCGLGALGAAGATWLVRW